MNLLVRSDFSQVLGKVSNFTQLGQLIGPRSNLWWLHFHNATYCKPFNACWICPIIVWDAVSLTLKSKYSGPRLPGWTLSRPSWQLSRRGSTTSPGSSRSSTTGRTGPFDCFVCQVHSANTLTRNSGPRYCYYTAGTVRATRDSGV